MYSVEATGEGKVRHEIAPGAVRIWRCRAMKSIYKAAIVSFSFPLARREANYSFAQEEERGGETRGGGLMNSTITRHLALIAADD